MKFIVQPAEGFFSQYELTWLREEKDGPEEEVETTKVRVKLLEGEVKKLRVLLELMKGKVKELEGERKDLEELVDDQEGKIAKVETLQGEVERLDAMNKLMWRHWKDWLNSHPEIEHEYL